MTYEKTLRASPNKKAAKPLPYKPSPSGEGGPHQRRSCAFISSTNAPLFPLYYPSIFHTIVTLSAPARHLPLEGKAAIREYHLLKKAAHHPCEPIRSPSTVIPSAAEGSLLHCRHMHTCALVQTTPWCFPLSPFPHPRFTGLQERSLHFGRDDI